MAAVTSFENSCYQNHLLSLKVVFLVPSRNASLPNAGELLYYSYFNTWIPLNCVAWHECAVNGAQWVSIPHFGSTWLWKRYRWIIWWACHIPCWKEQYFHNFRNISDSPSTEQSRKKAPTLLFVFQALQVISRRCSCMQFLKFKGSWLLFNYVRFIEKTQLALIVVASGCFLNLLKKRLLQVLFDNTLINSCMTPVIS